jgi:hypothetical protein
MNNILFWCRMPPKSKKSVKGLFKGVGLFQGSSSSINRRRELLSAALGDEVSYFVLINLFTYWLLSKPWVVCTRMSNTLRSSTMRRCNTIRRRSTMRRCSTRHRTRPWSSTSHGTTGTTRESNNKCGTSGPNRPSRLTTRWMMPQEALQRHTHVA